ncbi:MAG: hypothetical protein IJD17_05640 [Clostridia bacterium]|nr:hypothetical protein [Clostridia bacterium]
MSDQHKISEYIDGINFKKTFGMGFRPDDVYEAICNLTSMYNNVLSEAYRDNDKLRDQLFELRKRMSREGGITPPTPVRAVREPSAEPQFGTKEYFALEFARRNGLTDTADQAPDLSAEIPIPGIDPALADGTTATLGSDFPSVNDFESFWENDPEKKGKKEKRKKKAAPEAEKALQLRNLRRSDLLELLIEQSRENESQRTRLAELESKNAELQSKLDDRRIKIEKAGTLAEATFLINGVLESSEAAARQYLDNLQSLYDREEVNCSRKEEEARKIIENAERQSEEICRAAEERCIILADMTEKRCESMKAEAERVCLEKEAESRRRCDELEALCRLNCESRERQTEERCAEIERAARRDTEKYWTDLTARLEEFYNAHQGLRELLKATGHVPKI